MHLYLRGFSIFFLLLLFQVCCLGAVGFTCWMIKAPISGYWAAIANERMDIDDPPYFAWVVPRYAWRAISTAFLMGLFLKVDLRSLPLKNPDKINHFLVPLLIWAIFAAFCESVIDQYVGPLDSKLRFVCSGLFVCLRHEPLIFLPEIMSSAPRETLQENVSVRNNVLLGICMYLRLPRPLVSSIYC